MRVRNNPDAEKKLLNNSSIYISNPNGCKGIWKDIFKNDNPIHVEIGMGKGQFVYNMALRDRDINYIGIEKNMTILSLAIQRFNEKNKELKEQEIDEVSNIRYMSIDAANILDSFEKDEVDMIYLNFSDPWPKSKHDKRRLTYKDFLDKYKVILKDDMILQLKTDNVSLFDFSVVHMNNYGMKFECMAVDLHNSKHAETNIMTEYEEKFSNKGQPIFMLQAKF